MRNYWIAILCMIVVMPPLAHSQLRDIFNGDNETIVNDTIKGEKTVSTSYHSTYESGRNRCGDFILDVGITPIGTNTQHDSLVVSLYVGRRKLDETAKDWRWIKDYNSWQCYPGGALPDSTGFVVVLDTLNYISSPYVRFDIYPYVGDDSANMYLDSSIVFMTLEGDKGAEP